MSKTPIAFDAEKFGSDDDNRPTVSLRHVHAADAFGDDEDGDEVNYQREEDEVQDNQDDMPPPRAYGYGYVRGGDRGGRGGRGSDHTYKNHPNYNKNYNHNYNHNYNSNARPFSDGGRGYHKRHHATISQDGAGSDHGFRYKKLRNVSLRDVVESNQYLSDAVRHNNLKVCYEKSLEEVAKDLMENVTDVQAFMDEKFWMMVTYFQPNVEVFKETISTVLVKMKTKLKSNPNVFELGNPFAYVHTAVFNILKEKNNRL
jgi:hypothetical protein